MSMSKRFKHRNKAVVAGLATAAALAGGVGVAAASGSSGAPDNPKSSSQAEGPEQPEGTEQPEGAEQREPSLNGSVPVQEVAGENEKQASARLSAQAKITQQEAEQAALVAVPGTVSGSELGDENGSLVWQVDVVKADSSQVEVKVDAGNGKVLAQEAGDQSEGDSKDSGEAGEATTG